MLVNLCEQLLKVILRTAMFSMLNDYNIILLKKVLNVYHKNNFFYCLDDFIILHKACFMMTIVYQISCIAYGSLVTYFSDEPYAQSLVPIGTGLI